MILLRALALAAFLFIPGWLAFSLLRGDKGDVNGGERLFLAASLGVGTVSFCSLILALTSLYSLTLLLILVGSLCAAMGLAARKRIGWIFRLGFKDVILALAIAAIGLILFLSLAHRLRVVGRGRVHEHLHPYRTGGGHLCREPGRLHGGRGTTRPPFLRGAGPLR